MRLKNITFILENCDTITIDGKYIGTIQCSDIKKELRRIAINSVNMYECCDMFFIEINKNANTKKKPFDYSDFEEYEVFSRLTKYQDITAIKIILIDDIEDKEYIYDFYVSWNDVDETDNSYQTYYISELGDLYLMINKSFNVMDYIDKEHVNDSKMNDFYWGMLN